MSSEAKKGTIDMNKVKSRVLIECLALSLFISLSPLKMASYVLPVLLLLFIIFRLPSKALFKNLFFAAIIFAAIILFYFLKSFILDRDFNFVGAFLSLLTYGSLIFVFIYPDFRVNHQSEAAKKVNSFLYLVFVVETIVALLQFFIYIMLHIASFDTATGDIVQGTINPFSFINENVGFNNQVFTINYIFLLVYLVPYLRRTKQRYWLILGVLVIFMASVLHVVFSFVVALFTCFLLVGFIRYRKQVMKFIVLGCILVAFLFVTQPKNFSLFTFYYTNIVSLESPKSLILVNTVAFLPEEYPDALLIGLGPGQYTSRASLITTGRFFGEFENPTNIPLMDGSFTSKAFKDYVFDVWESYATDTEQYGNSTMSRPFFSVLSLCVELGVIAFVVIIILLFRKILKMRKQYLLVSKEKNKILAYYSFVNMVSIIFLFYLAFFENYLESSASICGGLLLVKYFNSINDN